MDGPSWSISVEIALYIIFFVACRLLRPGLIANLGLVALAFVLSPFSVVAEGAEAFFTGGITYFVVVTVLCYRRYLIIFPAAAIILILIVLGPLSNMHLITYFKAAAHVVAPVGWLGDYVVAGLKWLIPFATLIFVAALVEASLPSLKWRRLSGIGNISFGTYLLHFPLQLLFMSAALWLQAPNDIFTRSWVFVLFFTALLILAFASYRWLEKPAMFGLRSFWASEDRVNPSYVRILRAAS